jgi:hypothetical protein
VSKQRKAKKQQGYDPKPKQSVCQNCEHYQSDFVTQTANWGKDWTEEKNKRCGIGGFAVKKTATCKKFSLRVEDAQ